MSGLLVLFAVSLLSSLQSSSHWLQALLARPGQSVPHLASGFQAVPAASVKCIGVCEPVNGDLRPSLQNVVQESSRYRQTRASHRVVSLQLRIWAGRAALVLGA